jgi:hypothetical protein
LLSAGAHRRALLPASVRARQIRAGKGIPSSAQTVVYQRSDPKKMLQKSR